MLKKSISILEYIVIFYIMSKIPKDGITEYIQVHFSIGVYQSLNLSYSLNISLFIKIKNKIRTE